jgi:ABC-type lipoprotein release transport system permease subunit
MGAIRMCARAELRRRWRHVVALTIFVGFAGAVVLALFAGARRTDSSLARFEQSSRAANLEVDAGDATPAQIEAFRHAPGVAAVGLLRQFTMTTRGGRFLPTAGQLDDTFGKVIDRARVLDGRAADPDRADELTIGETLAEELHLHVGDRITFVTYTPDDLAIASTSPEPHGPPVSFRVVGIVRRPLDLGGRGAAGGVIVPGPAFTARYRDVIGSYAGTVVRVRTMRDADVARVASAARRIFGNQPLFSFTNLSVEGQGAQNAIDVTTVGLLVAAAVAALTTVAGIGIAISREIALSDADQPTLRAVGVRPLERVLAASAIGVPIALAGSLLAVLVASAASPFFPIGVARRAEPQPGIRIDGLALGAGFVVVALVVYAVAVLAATRSTRVGQSDTFAARPGLAARTMSQLGIAPPVAVGVRFAVDRGRGSRALPVWSSLLGASLGVLVVVAVLVFSAGLDHLVSTPAAFGWTWDSLAGDPQAMVRGPDDCSPIETRLTKLRGLAAVASICNGSVAIEKRPAQGYAIRELRGRIEPTIADGRAPTNSDEVALGADTLAAARKEVGDRVHITGPDRMQTFRVVGQAVFPSVSDPEPLADGAMFTPAGLSSLGKATQGWNMVVRYAPGADRPAVVRALRRVAGSGEFEGLQGTVPAEVDRVRQIRGLPVALAVFVSAVALTAVGFALVTAVRRRRHELAILKTLGFARGQLREVVAAHATTVGIVGLAVGIPLGLVAGRLTWEAVADELGVANDPVWPVLGLAVLVPTALIAVNVIAAVAARPAARTQPATVLRSE